MKQRNENNRQDTLWRAQEQGRQQARLASERIARSGGGDQINPPRRLSRLFVLLLGVVAGALVFASLLQNRDPLPPTELTELQIRATVVAPTSVPNVSRSTARPAQSMLRIGLISGHRGNDTGTVCADGYTEAQLNYETAVRTATALRARGHAVDILDEFDARLNGYSASVMLSIHADSCSQINSLATGFKVARSVDSTEPVEEDRLVACLTERYRNATKLSFNANTITHNMTRYHALYKVDQKTPAAIIELGFMYLDRDLLQKRNGLVASGIVDGLQCYLGREKP